jgi:S-adenosylmethionine-diacylglycerol 3-amino-3-carboxypropyl transferase
LPSSPDDRLSQAVRRTRTLSRQGVAEFLFAWMFKGLVYPQTWEDPEIDMQALAIKPDSHVVAIASGGRNILSYLIADPARTTAVDLNKAHVALNKLKLTAARELPTLEAFYRFFGEADEKANITAYWRFLAPHLDAETPRYWESRGAFGWGARRIAMFSRNLYHYRLLGRFIGLGHAFARLNGVEPRDFLSARSIDEQRSFFDTALAPMFDKKLLRWATAQQFSLYGLGIPPAQYEALAAAGDSNMAAVLRERVERLSCGFSLEENYFAWQAFGRCYTDEGNGPLPPYLRPIISLTSARADSVEVLNRSFTEYLESRPAA